jgi:hypothetical protein
MQRQWQWQRQQSNESESESESKLRGQALRGFFFTFVLIVMIATMTLSNTAAAHDRTGSGCDGSALVRRLVFVDQGRTDPLTIEIARAEVESIWATAGVHLLWVSGAPDATPRPDAYVVLREGRANVRPDAAMMRTGWFGQLGWVRFDREGARSHLVEVSLANVRLTLMYAWYGNSRLAFQPQPVQVRVLGRALGRVIAHEFGHWLLGQGHEPEGLMKASLQPHELMETAPPRLPAAWTDLNHTSSEARSDPRMARLRALCG